MKKYTLLVLILAALTELSGQTITLNTADTAPYSTEDDRGFYDVLLKEVFGNLSLDLIINHYPSERSITRADSGYDDGEFARISGISSLYPNLIRVDESLVSFNFVALVSADSDVDPRSWDDLKNLRIGYLRGWKIYEENVGTGENINVLNRVDSLFNMVEANRIDVALYSGLRALQYMNDHDISGLKIIDKPLSERPMYLYMNKRYETLVPSIEKEIRNMKDTGRYRVLYDTYLLKK